MGLFGLLLICLADPVPDPAPRFTAKMGLPGETFEARYDKGQAIWTLKSKGNSQCVVTATEGSASKILVRFVGLANTESLRVEVDDMVKLQLNAPAEDTAPGTLTAIKVKDVIEATITLKRSGKVFKIFWIERYPPK